MGYVSFREGIKYLAFMDSSCLMSVYGARGIFSLVKLAYSDRFPRAIWTPQKVAFWKGNPRLFQENPGWPEKLAVTGPRYSGKVGEIL